MLNALTLLRAMNGVEAADVLFAEQAAEKPLTVHRRTKRLTALALAAALLLALGTAAFAVSAYARSTASYPMENTGLYTSLSELGEAERIVGYPITAPERFSNGFAFQELRIEGMAHFDEEYQVMGAYYEVVILYTDHTGAAIRLFLSPVEDVPGAQEPPAPIETRVIDGVELRLSRDRYKLVPENYEKSEEDLAAEQAGHFYISFGSDRGEVTECEYAFADFRLGQVEYTLMDEAADSASCDRLADMAGELIAAARG